MLKDIIIQKLQQYIGQYVENIDPEKLNYSILKGIDAELTDLTLRPEAVVELLTTQLGQEVPVEVKAGHVDYIKFSFPWSNLFSANVQLELDGLYVLLGPINDRPYEEKKDRNLENAIKQAKLRSFEQSTFKAVADQAAKNPGFFEKLGKYILNNIQITIRNVHIRYEDSITNGDYSFAVGTMLQSFTVHTTNDRWEDSDADSSATILHKLGSLTDLSVYWNHYVQEADLVGKKKRLQSHVWKNLLKQSITTNRIREESFNHILRPVTVKAKVIMNNEDNFVMPRIYVEFSLPDIMCFFSRHQYLNLLKWIDASHRVQINKRYRKYHPNTPVRFNPKAWWHYAYTSVVEERIRPHNWTRVVEHRKKVVRYGQMYKTHLEFPDNKTLQEDLKKLEADMDLCNIIKAREESKLQFVAEAPDRARKKIKETREREKANESWFSWILGGSSVEPEVELEVNTEEDWLQSLSDEERRELYQGVGYDENSKKDTMPKEYIAYKVQLRLKNVSLTLENYGKPILKMTLSDMLTSYENRPGGNGARVLSHTESFTIEGASVDYKLVSLLTSNSNIYSTDNQMFTLDYELRPLSIHADQSLKLNVRPVEIFYDQHAVSQVLMFFQVPMDSPQVDINAIAKEKLMDMVEYSRSTLLYAIEQQSTFHISVHMKSPYIVIPQKGTLHQGGNLLICDLGNFTVESDLLQKENMPLHNATISELQAHLYDKFLFKISDVKVLLADSEEEWDMAQKNPNSEFHILPSTGLDIAFYRSVLNNNQQPQQKFDAMLQSLTLNVTDVQIVTLNNFMRNFPVPTTSTSTIDAMDVPPPQPDWRHIQIEMNSKQLKKMRRTILSRLTLDLAEPIQEEPVAKSLHSTLDSAQPRNRTSTYSEPDTDTYYSASDDSEDEMDKWTSYRKVKSVDDYITENNRMQMFMRASIGEIVIQVSLEQNRQRREYLMFRLDGFTADMAYTVWINKNRVIPSGVAFHARLRGIGMADKLHRGATGAYLDLLQTESENELISICYRQVKPECPDFGPVFKNIEHGATLTFNNLSIMFDQTGVCYLKKFLEDLYTRMYPKKDTLDDNPFVNMRSSTVDWSTVRLRNKSGSRSSRASVTDKIKSIVQEAGGPSSLIKIHVITCVNDVSLHLRNVETKFSELHIKGLESQFIARAKKMTFNCRLQKFFVTDLTPDTLYPNILEIGTDESPFFDLKVEQFKSDGMMRRLSRRSTEPLDYYARLHIGQLQVAFINKFFWEVTRFFEPLKSPELSDAAYKTKETVSKQMKEITPATIRIALVVKAHIPTVVVPQHSKSRDLFFVKFGNLEVWNQFERKEVPGADMSQEWNHFSAKLTSMQISKGKLLEDNTTFVVLHHLVEPVNFTASFSLALAPFVANIMYDVSGELNLVKVNMLKTDMKLVMDIMKENFGEGAPSAKPDLAKPSTMKPTSTMDSGVTVIQHDLDTPTPPEVVPGTPYNAVVTLQGLVLCLYEETNGTTSSIEKNFLSRFEVGKIKARANSHREGENKLDFNLSFHTMSIDDMRPNNTRAVRKVFYCTREEVVTDDDHKPLPMISVIYKTAHDGSQEADIRMEKITLNLNIPFLLRLREFYTASMGTGSELPPPPLPIDLDLEESYVDSPDLPAPVVPLKVFCTIKEPEIVLFADPSLEDSRIVVLKADIEVDMVNNDNTQKLGSKVKDLKMYSAQYSTQQTVSSWVIQPCDLTFERTYNILENHVDMSARITELVFCTSPSVLHFAFDVWALFGNKDSETSEDQATPHTEDYRNLWSVKPTSAEKWLNKIDNSSNNSFNPLIPQRSPSETLHVDIEQIHAYFQVRNLDHQVNLLHIRSSLNSHLHDWNKQFHMNAEMNLQVDFFNERLSVWEPLVEPVSEKEGVYRPWEVVIKVIRGRSYPMTFNYVQEGFNMEDCLRNDVQQLLHNSRHRSSSSESETDESTEMTVLRPKLPRKRSRIASDKSYESIKQGSIQGESDTEPDGLIHSITNKLGGIFSDDSSDDADVSETEDTDELHDPSLDKPVFLTPKGPVQVSMARRFRNAIKCHWPCLARHQVRSQYHKHARKVESGVGFDQVDGRIEEEEEEVIGPQCNYIVVASQDKLQLNVTPQAIHVLTDISQALTSPASLHFDCKDLPAFELHNMIGIHSTVTLHQDIKVYEDNVTGCTVKRAGDETSDLQIIPRSTYNGVDEAIVESPTNGLLTHALGTAAHVLTSAGAFVFDDDDDYLSGADMNQDRLRLQVDGFDLTSTILHRRACLQLIPLTPDKRKDSSDIIKHSIKYWFLLDIDVSHGRKVINILSPLKIKNSLTLDLNILCKTADLEKYLPERDFLGSKEYTKLTTLAPDQDYNVPLFLAYHCDLFVCPTQLSRYQIHNKGIYWKDLLMTKEKAKCFTCQGSGEDRSFNLKVLCKERTKLQPSQEIPKGVPYYVLHVKAPVMIHNYLPYDIQFSLEGTGNFSSLTHGESTPLYTVEQASPQKLHIQLQDYIGCDWTGIFEITQGLEEFKAVSMAPYDCAADENNNKQLTIIVNAKEKLSLDLYFYSPYWVLNKTDLPIQIRGSGSDAVYDCCPSNAVPLLFRFKKTKRKKAKVRVYNSKWSQSFSMDTIGNSGVVICYDKERQKRYRMMLQCQWSSLKLTRIVTILPFFLVVNNSSHNLRYMEENEETDLWEDLKKGKCCPLWPRTTSEKMFIKYEDSGVVSEHIPFNTLHNTVLRMEHGSALCVEVSGGIETPRTITFSDYDPGDAPVRVENLCDDVFITIHQINQHQMTVLPADRSILYTWDDPTGPRKLMWNVYGCSNKQDSEVDITKDGFYFKQLKIQLVQESGTYKYSPQQGRHHHDSSPEGGSLSGLAQRLGLFQDDSDAVDYMYDSDIDTTTLLKTNSYKMKIFWISFLDGQQRVILFTRDSRVADAARMMNEGEQASLLTMLSLDGLSLSVVSEAYEEVALVSVSSMPAMWQIEVKNKLKVLEDVTLVTWLEDKWIHGLSQASLEDRIEVDFANMRMTKPYIGDLCRVCPPGMLFQYRRSEHQTFIHAKVHHIQVDNQLHDAYYQTVLHPAPIPLNMIKKKGPKPFIEFGMIRRCVPENNVDTFRQLQVIVQEFSVQLDWGFIESIQDTFADLVPKPESECARLQSDLILAQKHLNDLAEVKDRSTKRIFFEMCKISPLKLHVSFSFRGTPHLTRDVQPNITSDVKEFLRNSVGATFIEVKDVELKFGYFEKRGASLSWKQLTSQMVAHYRQQLILQVYVVVLGLDVLGNPYGLMQDISQGLGDLFYEPLLDTIQGDDEFSENMIRGFHSAMGHIVGGGANSVARITGTFGGALAYLSFDKEFQKKRRRRMQQQPADLPHSMAMAGKGFLTGIKYGLTGIVLDPYQGASEDGVEGFFKGIGRGILGLITQPIGGVLDMVSLAFDGVRRAAELEGGVVMRMRLPRCIDNHRGLKPYSEYRARGSHILKGIKGGKYSKTDVFRNFAPLSHEDKADLVFITNRHILYLEKCRFSGGYDVEWEVELKSILGVPALIEDEKKLVIHLKDNTGSLFSDNNVEITSLEIDILKWIQKKLETVLSNQIYKV